MSSIKAKGLQQTVVGSTTQPLHLGGIAEDFSDAIITIDSSGVIEGVSATYTGTIASTGWTGSSAPFTLAVTVTGILSTDNPIIDLVLTGTYATDQTMVENWAKIYRAVTTTDTITFHANEVPSASISFQAKVVR